MPKNSSNRKLLKQREVLAKADLAVSNLTNDGGLMLATQAKKFMRLVIDESVFLQDVTFVPMSANTYRIDQAKFGSRVLRKANAGQPLVEGDRSKPDLSKVEITTQEFMGEVDLFDEVLEDNIEGPAFQDTILQMVAEAVSRDIEEVALLGDTASGDQYLAAFDGFVKMITSNTFDAQDTKTSKATWREMLRALPNRYMRNKADYVIYTSVDSAADYFDTLTNRVGDQADKDLRNGGDAGWWSIPVRPIPLLPENVGTGTHCCTPLMLDPKNAHVGMQRKVRMETDRDIRARAVIIVITVRFGCKYREEQATVKATNVKVNA